MMQQLQHCAFVSETFGDGQTLQRARVQHEEAASGESVRVEMLFRLRSDVNGCDDR